uniref:Serine acetyltransferase n=1 Tax=Ascaris lumbricoides TaxID=6252 RepID=A0A0M3HII2_ASCLU
MGYFSADPSSRSWPQNDAFEQIRRWLREGYYCPIEDLEVWLAIPSFDSHVRQCVWQTVNSVMREIESPLVRLIPVITFARNCEPRQALNSLAQAGYDGLVSVLKEFPHFIGI